MITNNDDIKLINPLNMKNNLSYIENENNELNRTDEKLRLKIQQKQNNGNNNQVSLKNL